MSKQSRTIYLPVLSLPVEYRDDLSKPQGILVVHPSRGIVKGLIVDIAVGDVVSRNHKSIVQVVDFKTKRNEELDVHLECSYIAVNPPGAISINSVTIIDVVSRGVICIIGEEDLLVIPFLRQEGKRILYGQPNTGVVLIETKKEISIKAFKILKPTVIKYSTGG